jgi:predicted phosphodiesterase
MQLKKKSYFIGHVYGKHGNVDIPDKSLKNFLEKHKANFIIFGGDLTEKKENFNIFYDYFRNTKFLAVRGNHDGNLFNKIPFWSSEKSMGFQFIILIWIKIWILIREILKI